MQEESIKKDKIRNILTPDVQVCGGCCEQYKEEASCASCGKNMLHSSYNGMVYECPLCGELYCEACWTKMEPEHKHGHEREPEKKGLFNK
jgi:predicted RNA-binding Zn-ribbon protein involved in translation (DUF1610 family)